MKQAALTVLAWAMFALPCLLAAAPAHAQVGIVGDPIAVCVQRVQPGETAVALLARPTGFDCTTDQRRFGPGDYWVASTPIAVGEHWPARIRIASLWQNSATLWARYADGMTVRLDGDGAATSERIQLGAIIEYKLPHRHIPVVRLLWQIDGAANLRGIVVAARSASGSESAKSNLVMAALYAGFAGLCLSLLLYNIALWAALRHRFQLAYCGMVTALLIYAFTSSGALAWAWPGIPNNDRLRINIIALALSATAALSFARSFFEAKVFAGWLGRASTAVTTAVIGSAALFTALAPWQAKLLDRLYSGSFALLILIACPALYRAWKTRSNYLWVFAIAWAAPVVLAGLRIVNGFGLTPWSFWIDNSTLLAMALEAGVSSLAIAYRIRLLSLERDEAREQEIAARLLADTDPLTGLLNRRAFLHRAIGRVGPQTLLVFDIDHFKHVNDTIGHDGGDEVLRVVARALRAAVPADALVARIGGEEFAIVAAAADAPLPASVLDALRAERMPFDIAVTASVGACTGPLERETDWKLLYRRADQALFAAKAAGRDRARDAGVVLAA